MADKKITVFTRTSKLVKKIPTLVKIEHKVDSAEAAEKKILDLQKTHENYIEVVNEITGFKTVYQKTLGGKNYTKKNTKI